MFERFTPQARETVVRAQAEARRRHSGRVGTEHLLLALLAQDTPTSAVLAGHGLTRETVGPAVTTLVGDDLDADALGSLGIDLAAVRERVEEAFGPGALVPGHALSRRARAVRPAGEEGPRAVPAGDRWR